MVLNRLPLYLPERGLEQARRFWPPAPLAGGFSFLAPAISLRFVAAARILCPSGRSCLDPGKHRPLRRVACVFQEFLKENAFSSASASRPQTLFRGTEASRQTNAKYRCPRRLSNNPTTKQTGPSSSFQIYMQAAGSLQHHWRDKPATRHTGFLKTACAIVSPQPENKCAVHAKIIGKIRPLVLMRGHDHGLGLRRQFVEYPAEFLFGCLLYPSQQCMGDIMDTKLTA